MTRDPYGRLGNAELALAYELHMAGYLWRHIASGLGISVHYLRVRIQQAERKGLHQRYPITTPAAAPAAL